MMSESSSQHVYRQVNLKYPLAERIIQVLLCQTCDMLPDSSLIPMPLIAFTQSFCLPATYGPIC